MDSRLQICPVCICSCSPNRGGIVWGLFPIASTSLVVEWNICLLTLMSPMTMFLNAGLLGLSVFTSVVVEYSAIWAPVVTTTKLLSWAKCRRNSRIKLAPNKRFV